MDAVAALEWVQRNIAQFGGDTKNVTVFGQSAGGGMVMSLLSLPRGKGCSRRRAWNPARACDPQTACEG